jgi:methylated-DNA-[protein]-cysteine S-methyltransferase
MIFYDTMPSPVGPLLLVAEDAGLSGVYFETYRHGRRPVPEWIRAPEHQTLEETRAQLEAYFVGGLSRFSLPLAAQGTAFQQRVWAQLRRIAYGETVSYGELARRIGDPRAVRAVAGANARNPISIIVPCHRVIGADGSLTGFGGGLDRKRWLLEHESRPQRASILEARLLTMP